jgi:hypothetical protein
VLSGLASFNSKHARSNGRKKVCCGENSIGFSAECCPIDNVAGILGALSCCKTGEVSFPQGCCPENTDSFSNEVCCPVSRISGTSLTDEGRCCAENQVGFVSGCCNADFVVNNEKSKKCCDGTNESTFLDGNGVKGCCPISQLIASVNSAPPFCCPENRVYIESGVNKCCELNSQHTTVDGCCLAVQVYDQGTRCCATKTIEDLCCGNDQDLVDGKCCTNAVDGTCCNPETHVFNSGFCCSNDLEEFVSGYGCCVKGNIKDAKCCPNSSDILTSSNECCQPNLLVSVSTAVVTEPMTLRMVVFAVKWKRLIWIHLRQENVVMSILIFC